MVRALAGLVAAAVLALIGAPEAVALTPTNGGLYGNKVAVEAPCSLADHVVDGERQAWQVYTADPRRAPGGPSGGVDLLPATLPRVETMGEWVVDDDSPGPRPQGWSQPEDSCVPTPLDFNAEVQGASLILGRPGPYVMMVDDFTDHWTQIAEASPDPTPLACSANDSYYQSAQTGPPDTPPSAGQKWVNDSFCNKVTIIPFNVQGDTGACPASGDYSQWPTPAYINQYDAGARLGLPLRFGQAGGNASGPSSLLMALQQGGAPVVPGLLETFDNVMQLSRAEVAANGPNSFVRVKAVAFLKSLGYRQARVLYLGSTSQAANLDNPATLYQEVAERSPVLLSTAFGSGRWGVTGGGHMIAVTGIRDGNFVVSDPAGNYFSSPTNHYGAGRCGYGVTYPVDWVKAYMVGRSIVHIGARTPLPAPLPRAVPRAATYSSGTALLVTDTNPGSPDNPRTFYLRDGQGRRTGFIDGAIVEEIPDSFAGKEPQEHSETSNGDPAIDISPSDPPPTPRAIVVPNPAGQTTLHVVQDAGVPYALSVDAWGDGRIVGHDALTGTGTGQDAVLPFAALGQITTPTIAITPTPSPAPAAGPATGRLTVSRLTVSPTTFRAARSGPSARSGKPENGIGTEVSITANVAASMRFTVERRTTGRRSTGKCVATTARNRRAKPCTRYVRVAGSFTRAAKSGANSFVFTGRIGGRRLAPARYRLVAAATVAGRTSAQIRTAFRVKR